MTDTFWLNNPYILLNKNGLTQLFPNSSYTTIENLNAVTRTIILISIVGYAFTQSSKILMSLFVSLIVILIYYKYISNNNKKNINKIVKEGFDNPEFYDIVKNEYSNPTKNNPMMNVLLTDIHKKPVKKEAAPSFTKPVENEINQKVKDNLDPRLFKDLGDNIVFEQSMRNFYTMPNTEIVNDQEAFAKFCYGGMESCKDGDVDACTKNNFRHINP